MLKGKKIICENTKMPFWARLARDLEQMGYFFVFSFGRIGFLDPKSTMCENYSFLRHLNQKLIFCVTSLLIEDLSLR